jgi:hypothetical protein
MQTPNGRQPSKPGSTPGTLLTARRRRRRICCAEKENDVETEHAEKTHPIAGYITAIVLAGLVFWLMGALNTNEKAIIGVPFLLGWALVSLYIFNRRSSSEDH